MSPHLPYFKFLSRQSSTSANKKCLFSRSLMTWLMMNTWWSLGWLRFYSWTLRQSTNKLFARCLFRATDYFLLLIKFRNISTLGCYSCSEHSLVPPRHCAPSNEMTILTKTKGLFWQKQNDHSDKNKMTIPTKKIFFLKKTQQVLLFSPDSLGSSRAGP